MANYSTLKISGFLRRADEATNSFEKGKALEDLVCYLFGKVPGIEITLRNQMNSFSTEEIDIGLWNAAPPKGFYFFPHVFLLECKNWNQPVGSSEVSYFAGRLRHRACQCGILIAANGITGVASDLTAAHYEVAMALSQGTRILILTRNEIEKLTDTVELVHLIKRKVLELTVAGSIVTG